MTILGLSFFTWFHTLLSLVMLVAGFVVVKDLFHSRVNAGWMAVFLISGVLTNVTGFGFPFSRFTEFHYTAIISLVVLAGAILGLYVFKLAGPWRWIFALSVVLTFYTDALVAIAQLFKKVPALGAPTREQRAAVRRRAARPAGDHHLAVRQGLPRIPAGGRLKQSYFALR